METITVMPTRGMIYAQTINGLRNNNLDGFLTIEGLGIPDAQNEAVRRALEEYSSYVLFIEDDVVMPDGALERMIKMDKAIVAVDYPMENGYSTICKKGDEIQWCAIGCTLIKTGVLRNMPKPIFDTSYSWLIKSTDPLELERSSNPYKYGGADINFCIKAREMGYEIAQLEGFEAKHLRHKKGRTESNQGTYGVYALPEITKYQHYK